MNNGNKVLRIILKTLITIGDFIIQFFVFRFAIIMPFEVFIMSNGVGIERIFMLLLGILIGLLGLSTLLGLWIGLIMFWTLINEAI